MFFLKNIKKIMLINLFFITLFIDQLSKILVLSKIIYKKKYIIFKNFNFILIYNNQFIFNIFTLKYKKQKYLFILISIILIIYYLFIVYQNTDNNFLCILLIFILSGSICNTIDRIKYNYVIDFLNINYGILKLLIFNIADIYIYIGSLFLIIYITYIKFKIKY